MFCLIYLRKGKEVREREELLIRMDSCIERIGFSWERRGPFSPFPIIELKMDLYSRCPIKLVLYFIFGSLTFQVSFSEFNAHLSYKVSHLFHFLVVPQFTYLFTNSFNAHF